MATIRAPSPIDEIVVCARRPDDERYRIPEPLRRSERRTEASWSSHAAELDEIQRDTRPDELFGHRQLRARAAAPGR